MSTTSVQHCGAAAHETAQCGLSFVTGSLNAGINYYYYFGALNTVKCHLVLFYWKEDGYLKSLTVSFCFWAEMSL